MNILETWSSLFSYMAWGKKPLTCISGLKVRRLGNSCSSSQELITNLESYPKTNGLQNHVAESVCPLRLSTTHSMLPKQAISTLKSSTLLFHVLPINASCLLSILALVLMWGDRKMNTRAHPCTDMNLIMENLIELPGSQSQLPLMRLYAPSPLLIFFFPPFSFSPFCLWIESM